MRALYRTLPFVALAGLAGCEPSATDEQVGVPKDVFGKADSSNQATVLNFEFDTELLTDNTWGSTSDIVEDQLLYSIGHLNGDRAVGRLDKLTLTNVQSSSVTGGKRRIRYHAVLPVAWGAKTNLPTSYAFKLPHDVSSAASETFTSKYKGTCVDIGAHDVDSGSMWYYYRPNRSGCAITDAELMKFTARVTVSQTNTTGKYPEYHKVWEDNELRVVAIFGKFEDGATTASDAGIDAFNTFVRSIKSAYGANGLTTTPASIPSSPGVSAPDIELRATLAGGRKLIVNALLVDKVSTAPPSFDTRYAQVSSKADLIMYNGHAGLGQNVRALARKGRFVQGQYVIVFMNGCDTFAYVDGYLAETRAAINPDDPTGTKYMEIVTNAMPAFFASDAGASMALIKGLVAWDNPTTYEQIFTHVDDSQVVLVSGEEDNVYHPGYTPGGGGGGGGSGDASALLDEMGAADKGEDLSYQTDELAPGQYTVTMTGNAGDANLYARVGQAPTHALYDCRPYQSGSNEVCKLAVSAPAKIYILVNGYASGANAFHLVVSNDGAAPPPPPAAWTGLDESGSVARDQEKRFQTPVLAAGSYQFTLSGTGDADLYVRTGAAPTTSTWECRPYLSSSSESCTVQLSTPAPIHVMLRGYAASSTFHLLGKKN